MDSTTPVSSLPPQFYNLPSNNLDAINKLISQTDILLQKSNRFYSFISDLPSEEFSTSSRHRWGPWGHWGRHHHHWDFRLGQSSAIVGDFSSGVFRHASFASSSNHSSTDQTIPLDVSKPSNIWAFPVPSSDKADTCRDLQGKGVWTRDGVWRCLFPNGLNAKTRLDNEANRSEVVFADYGAYLDWKRRMKSMIRERTIGVQQNEYPQQQQQQQTHHVCTNHQQHEKQNDWVGQNSSFDTPKQNSYSDQAIVAEVTFRETYKKPDGTFETKETIKKNFKNGNSTTVERIHSAPDISTSSTLPNSNVNSSSVQSQIDSSESGSGGWFWKR